MFIESWDNIEGEWVEGNSKRLGLKGQCKWITDWRIGEIERKQTLL